MRWGVKGTKAATNPVFYVEELALALQHDPERFEAVRTEPDNADLFTWNIFSSLDTHEDADWLAYRLRSLGAEHMRGPVRIALWTGRDREPFLRPSRRYLAAVRQRNEQANADPDATELTAPVEVSVRIEVPETLILVDTVGRVDPHGPGGRDRLVALIDGGIDHARRLSKTLAVAVVYPANTSNGEELSSRVDELRDPGRLGRELGAEMPPISVVLRELTWERLFALWEAEVDAMHLSGQPVKAFLEHARERGLR